MHFAIRAVVFEGGVCYAQNGSQKFRSYKCYDIFDTFVTNTPLWGKNVSKVWNKYSLNISPHFLDAAEG